jgi:hypothetical protein
VGLFDEFVGGEPPSAEELSRLRPTEAPTDPAIPRIRVTPAPPRSNQFDQYISGPVAEQKPATINRPFGELKPADPSWTEWAKSKGQDVLMALGAEPYRARHMSEGLVGIGSSLTPMGGVLSAADLSYDLPRGNYGHAALDALGSVPGVTAARRAIQGVPRVTPAFSAPFRETERGVAQPGGFVTPSADELRNTATAGYRAVEQAPLSYHPDAMGDYVRTAQTVLPSPRFGPVFSPEKAPGVFSTLDRFERNFPSGGTRPVTAADFDTLRQQLKGLPEGIGTANGPAGRQAIDILDTYMTNPPRGALHRGTQQDLANLRETLADARGNWRALKTSEGVTDAIDTARVTTGTAHSGKNLDNRTRQEIAKFVKSPAGEAKLFGATDAELNAIENAAVGDATTNALRSWGNRLGGGGGAGQTVIAGMGATAGGTLAHMMGLGPAATAGATAIGAGIPAVAGGSLRSAANARTALAAEEVAAGIRRNSPLSRARAALPENQPVADPRAMYRDAITMAMIPRIKDEGKDIWDRAYVPYANR